MHIEVPGVSPSPTLSATPSSTPTRFSLPQPSPSPALPSGPALTVLYLPPQLGSRRGDWLRTRKDRALAPRPRRPMGVPARPDGRAALHQWGRKEAGSCGPGER